MNGVIDYNWLGVAFVSDNLSPEIHREVEKEMDMSDMQINEKFDK